MSAVALPLALPMPGITSHSPGVTTLGVDLRTMLQTPTILRKTLTALCAPLLALLATSAQAQTPQADARIPAAVESALQRAKIPREAVSLMVMDVDGKSAPRLAWRTHQPMNPASVMKLVTTYAALDQLGPAYVWRTPVYLGGPVVEGALRGNLYT